LEARIEIGARGHERKQGAPDGVGGGREGDLGRLVLLVGTDSQAVTPGPGLLADVIALLPVPLLLLASVASLRSSRIPAQFGAALEQVGAIPDEDPTAGEAG
jgi:hypothetical protein